GLIGSVVVLSAAGNEPLTLTVSPTVAFAPATVRVRVRIQPDAGNRRLTIVADGPELYRSSEIQLDGEQAPQTFEMWFRDLPGSDYQVYAILTDAVGRERARAHRPTKVMPQ